MEVTSLITPTRLFMAKRDVVLWLISFGSLIIYENDLTFCPESFG